MIAEQMLSLVEATLAEFKRYEGACLRYIAHPVREVRQPHSSLFLVSFVLGPHAIVDGGGPRRSRVALG